MLGWVGVTLITLTRLTPCLLEKPGWSILISVLHVSSWDVVTPQALDVISFQIDVPHLSCCCKCKWCLEHSSFASVATSIWPLFLYLAKPWTFNWHIYIQCENFLKAKPKKWFPENQFYPMMIISKSSTIFRPFLAPDWIFWPTYLNIVNTNIPIPNNKANIPIPDNPITIQIPGSKIPGMW